MTITICIRPTVTRVACKFLISWPRVDPITVYPKKYAHGFVVLCFVVVMHSFMMNSHEVFIHINQGCFAGTGAIVRLPQCQWSKPDGYGKISQCITTTKHSKAKKPCAYFLGYTVQPLTHCDRVTPYGTMDLARHCAWWHKASIWINIDLLRWLFLITAPCLSSEDEFTGNTQDTKHLISQLHIFNRNISCWSMCSLIIPGAKIVVPH